MFGKVIDIIVLSPEDCLFVLCPYVGSNFSAHYNAYEVHRAMSQYILCQQKHLIDHHLLSISTSFSPALHHKYFVCLKYQVCK